MENLPDFDEPAAGPAPGSRPAAGALSALEEGLAGSIAGLRILDRELELPAPGGGLGRVDLAGIDGEGRLVLVGLLEDGAGDAAALAALDLLALGTGQAALLARHLGVAQLGSPEGPSTDAPRCVLVAEDFGQRLLGRLAPFGDRVELLRLATIASGRGARTYLVQVHPGGASNLPDLPAPCTREDFLDPLAPGPRQLVRTLLERLERMDSEFELRFTPQAAHWAFRGRGFLSVEVTPAGLLGRVHPGGEGVPLEAEAAVESLVEQAFGVYVRLLGLFDEGAAPYDPAARLAAEVPAEALNGASNEAPDEPAHEGPILTPEEIAAFQL